VSASSGAVVFKESAGLFISVGVWRQETVYLSAADLPHRLVMVQW